MKALFFTDFKCKKESFSFTDQKKCEEKSGLCLNLYEKQIKRIISISIINEYYKYNS